MNKFRQIRQNAQTAVSQRQIRIRKKVFNVTDRPRLSIYRSNQYCYAQVIDKNGNTIVGMSENALDIKGGPVERAKALGAALAKKAMDKKVTAVVFDKGRFAYHGRVKAIAEGAREGGLQF